MSRLYRFDQYVLDPTRRVLLRGDSSIPLTPKAFDILLFLAEHPNRVVTKEELLKAVWADTFVEEGNITQNVSLLRKALGDKSDGEGLIVTVARKGYQFTADVVSPEGPSDSPSSADGTASSQRASRWLRIAIPIVVLILALGGYVLWRDSQRRAVAALQKPMLAVLPFQNLTGDPNQEYLADGLTEELIAQLSRLRPSKLGVIARTSVMGYKHSDKRLDQIGRELSVQYVLESSLRRGVGRLRITVQLLDVKDQSHLWAADYDYAPGDNLTLQDDVSAAVAREIKLRLTSQPHATERPSNSVAFDAYLQGRYFFQKSSDKRDLNRAVDYYQQALKVDPSYAPAWVGLSRALFRQADKGFVPGEDGYEHARKAANRALELDPDLAEAHAQIAWIKEFYDWDWAGADDEFQNALALAPGNSIIVSQAASTSMYLGRVEKALELDRRAVELDPLNALSCGSRGQHLYFAGRPEDAAKDLNRSLELNPDLPHTHQLLGLVYRSIGRQQDALSEIDREPAEIWRLQGQALVYQTLGRRNDADIALAEYIAKYQIPAAYEIAEIYAFRGENNKAFEWLDRAYAQHDAGLVALKVDPLLLSVHGDTRYHVLLEKMRLL